MNDRIKMTNEEAMKRYRDVSILQPLGLVGVVLFIISLLGIEINYVLLCISFSIISFALIAVYRFSQVRKAAQQ